MARLNSFYLPTASWPELAGDSALLEGSEARHMLTVLRTGKDQAVRLFDGQGRTGLFRVKESSKSRALLEAIQLEKHPAPTTGVTLAIGWGKSKRRNYLFEKVVELQGLGIVFWQSIRSQGQMPKEPKSSWQDKCLQAAKQCGSVHLPVLSTVTGGLNDLIALARQHDRCYLAWESDSAQTSLSPNDLADGTSLIVIGPEGGLEESEAAKFMEAGFIPVTLGKSILRWETAATYCLSLGWYARQVK